MLEDWFPLLPRMQQMSPGNSAEAGLEGGGQAKEEGGTCCVAIARMGLLGGRDVSAEGSSKVSAEDGSPVVALGKEDWCWWIKMMSR